MTHACQGACAGLLAGVLTLSPLACTRQDQLSAPPDFFPLHTDDTWVYEVVRPLRNQRTRMTVRVRDERYVGALGRHCRLVDESYAAESERQGLIDGISAQPQIYPIAYYRKDGFLYRALSLEYRGNDIRDIGIGTGEERFLPDAFGNNQTWDSVTTAYELGGGNGYDVRQVHHAALEPEAVEVPAGRFTACLRVDTVALHGGRRDGKYEGEPLILYYSDWYAPNVGLVRTRQANRPNGNPPLAQIELVAYDVAH